jgi:hypothetical protein
MVAISLCRCNCLDFFLGWEAWEALHRNRREKTYIFPFQISKSSARKWLFGFPGFPLKPINHNNISRLMCFATIELPILLPTLIDSY